MKTKYDALGNFLNEARTDGIYWEEDAGTEGTPEWIIAQTLGLIDDVKALAEALKMASVYVDGEGSEDECEMVRAALKRIQGEAG